MVERNKSADRTVGPAEEHPLSFAQERLWFLDQLQPENPAYNVPQAWRLDGELNAAAFRKAIDGIVRRHETLRTAFAVIDGRPVQVIAPFRPCEFEFTDVSGQSDSESELRRLLREASRRPFDLSRGPLFRVHLYRLNDHEHAVLFNLHHIIADAWSFEILRRELSALYSNEISGAASDTRFPALSELPIQYLDYAHWQRGQVRGERMRRDLAYWKERLAGELPALELPADSAPSPLRSYAGASVPFHLSREQTLALADIGRSHDATLFMVMFTAFNVFLHRITGQNDLIVGTPFSGRTRTETEGLIGLFVNTLPLRTDTGGDPKFSELLGRVRESVLNAFAHQHVPFGELVRAVQPERARHQSPLFQAVLAIHGGYPAEWALGDLRATLMEVETGTSKFDWAFLLEETDWGLRGRLEYDTDLFEAYTVTRFLQQFQLLLDGLIANPQRHISEFPLLTAAERTQLVRDWNQTDRDYERHACIHELFEAQAERIPDAIALSFEHGEMSYGELNRRADRLAQRLKSSGVGPDVPVGLCVERSPEMIVGMLAILKAGGAYVPLDPAYPRDRLAFMLEDSTAPVVLAGANVESILPKSVKVVPVGSRRGDEAEDRELVDDSASSPRRLRAEGLAYVMYTSGSTGTPKGTAIPHRAVVRLVRNPNYVNLSAQDVFLQLAPISFDASTFEIWGCLLNGGRLVLFPPRIPSMEELADTIQANGVTTLWLTAGLFHQLVDHGLEKLQSVRQLLAGGDVLSVPHVLKALRELPDCQLINGYGPTENTTFTCCHRIPRDWPGDRSVPIGKPVSNTRVYVLDDRLAPVPIGVPGELCAGGDGLARGYWRQPELTDEKFIANPFDDSSPESKLYRTGDRVRWLPDGALEFLGRNDQQVKIRGFRVEPAEIEAALAQHPAIRECAVVARATPAGDRRLAAFIVFNSAGAVAGRPARPDAGALRSFLEARLPSHLVPSWFVELDNLPLTPNGKVDRRALPAPEVETLPAGPAFSPPRNPTETTLMQIWSELLERNSFGVHENFFHLGGHSLLATQVVSRIARAFDVDLPVRAIFESPTIAALAPVVDALPRGLAASRPRIMRRQRVAESLSNFKVSSSPESVKSNPVVS